MTDNLTKEQRRRNMQNIRSSKTLPENIIAAELKKRKIYFAQNVTTIFGRPDFVFRRKRVVVFIDSCFWHKCQYHYVQPKSNLEYWVPKIMRNVERDRLVTKTLREMEWKVIRIWEHTIYKNPLLALDEIMKHL